MNVRKWFCYIMCIQVIDVVKIENCSKWFVLVKLSRIVRVYSIGMPQGLMRILWNDVMLYDIALGD